jgi:hypothetical protein
VGKDDAVEVLLIDGQEVLSGVPFFHILNELRIAERSKTRRNKPQNAPPAQPNENRSCWFIAELDTLSKLSN